MTRYLRFRTLLAGLAASLVLVAMTTVSASASGGTSLDGTDPSSSPYCANGSQVISSQTLRIGGTGAVVGTAELRYSPSCGTNWVRVLNSGTSGATVQKYIERRAQNGLPAFSQTIKDYNVGWSYGNQVYAPGSTCIWWQGGISTSAWTAYSPYTQVC